MRKVKEEFSKLKNIYTGETVVTSNLYEKRVEGPMTFIQVFAEQNPQRKYFVNLEAFKKITK